MRTKLWVAIGLALAMTAGCTPVITRDKLESISTIDSSDHVMYVGSDANYHYFDRHHGNSVEHYRVKLADVTPYKVFALGVGKPYLWPWEAPKETSVRMGD